MKKVFFFLIFINSAAYIEYEIFEYSIRDIRMRKKLQPVVTEQEMKISIDIPVSTQDKKNEPICSDSVREIQSPYDLITIKNLAIIHEKNETTPSEKKITEKEELKNKKTLVANPAKKASYLQKEFDVLTLEPMLTKKAEKSLDNHVKKSTMTISIQNNINQEMTAYHHWSGSYTPEFFIIINETVIPTTTDIVAPLGQPLKIEYKAIFPYGYSSADFIHYEPKESVKKIILEFDWHKTPRIIITEIES